MINECPRSLGELLFALCFCMKREQPTLVLTAAGNRGRINDRAAMLSNLIPRGSVCVAYERRVEMRGHICADQTLFLRMQRSLATAANFALARCLSLRKMISNACQYTICQHFYAGGIEALLTRWKIAVRQRISQWRRGTSRHLQRLKSQQYCRLDRFANVSDRLNWKGIAKGKVMPTKEKCNSMESLRETHDASKQKRLTLVLDDEDVIALDEIKSLRGKCGYSQILRDSIQVMQSLAWLLSAGGEIILRQPDGSEQKVLPLGFTKAMRMSRHT